MRADEFLKYYGTNGNDEKVKALVPINALTVPLNE